MKYIEVIPEVIVGLGDRTEFAEKEPPFKTVTKLHILLEDWLGDDLMTCHPCFIVTESLKTALESSSFTGFEFANMKITKDEYFVDNYQLEKPLPKFHWMKIIGKENKDSFYINDVNFRLMLSEEIYNWLKKRFIINYLTDNNSDIDDFMKRFLESQKGNN